jgi:nucleoside-diphosphate-sugar epimerase
LAVLVLSVRLTTRLIGVGHTVTIADKSNSRKHHRLWTYADVRDPESLEKALANADIVVNLTAEHLDDITPKSLYDDVNVIGAEKESHQRDPAGEALRPCIGFFICLKS